MLNNYQKLKDKKVLITGGSRGIGLAISKMMAENDAKVGIVYRSNDERAKEAYHSLKGDGHSLFKCDVGDPKKVEELFDKIRNNFGLLDMLINNAGMGFHHPIDSSSYNEWQEGWNKIINTNLLGPSNMCFHAAQVMIQNRSGRIINVSSRGAFRGEPEQPAYGASKAGLNSLTQSLAHQLAPYGIFVGAVAPGFVETEMAFDRLQGSSGEKIKAQSPMNRVATPQEVAQAVLLMATANQWMTGGIFDVNGASYFRT